MSPCTKIVLRSIDPLSYVELEGHHYLYYCTPAVHARQQIDSTKLDPALLYRVPTLPYLVDGRGLPARLPGICERIHPTTGPSRRRLRRTCLTSQSPARVELTQLKSTNAIFFRRCAFVFVDDGRKVETEISEVEGNVSIGTLSIYT